MYSDKVKDHFENPRNMGEMENASGVGTVGNADIFHGIVLQPAVDVFTAMVAGKSTDTAVLLDGEIAAVNLVEVCGIARAVAIVHAAGGDGISKEEPAVVDAL